VEQIDNKPLTVSHYLMKLEESHFSAYVTSMGKMGGLRVDKGVYSSGSCYSK